MIETRKNNGYIYSWLYDNPQKKEEIREKTRQTNIERYGGPSPTSNKEVKEKQKKSRLEKYNGKYTIYSNELLKYLSDKQFDKETQEKIKKTSLLRYGVEHYSQSQEFKDYIHKHHKEIVEKGNKTKRKNGTFNTSKPEQESYRLLLEKFPDIQKEYKEERYPFNCDFYIPSIDLFIECQYHWTHGDHPFDINNELDVELSEEWKNSESKFKNNAWNTWTIRDVNKREIANKNNLNWIEFFTFEEFEKWLNS